MRGDALASGERSATFFPPALEVDIADPEPYKDDFDCVCGVSYGNVSAFCDHARTCDGRPKVMGNFDREHQTVNAGGSCLAPFLLTFAMAACLRKGEITIAAPPNLLEAVRNSLPPYFDSVEIVEHEALKSNELHLVDILGRTIVELVNLG